MPIRETRGPTFGRCNICGDEGPLTVDHTPPKGYAPAVAVKISHIAERLGSAHPARTYKAPDGVKYRSLCKRCNNEILGGQCDPSLIKAAQDITRLLQSPLVLPAITTIRTNPQRLVRSVLGHMAAQGVGRSLDGDYATVRQYLLDQSAPMPANVRLHYWVYPHAHRMLMRDVVISVLGSNRPSSVIWLMKCFPLAFAAIWELEHRFEGFYQPRDFDAYANFGIDDLTDLPIDLRHVPDRDWPELGGENTLLLMGEQAITATVSPPRGFVLRNITRKQ